MEILHNSVSPPANLLSPGSGFLPAPGPGQKIKAITVGRGIQNYTCEPNSTKPPVPIGAIADLYDVSPLLQFLPPDDATEILDLLPRYLIDFDFAALDHDASIPILGHHYFNAAGVPTFDLGPKIGVLKGKRDASIGAPPDASKGPSGKGVGAVDWLRLCAVAGSHELSLGYRVETAGGKAPKSCRGQPKHIQVQYAAQYWFLH